MELQKYKCQIEAEIQKLVEENVYQKEQLDRYEKIIQQATHDLEKKEHFTLLANKEIDEYKLELEKKDNEINQAHSELEQTKCKLSKVINAEEISKSEVYYLKNKNQKLENDLKTLTPKLNELELNWMKLTEENAHLCNNLKQAESKSEYLNQDLLKSKENLKNLEETLENENRRNSYLNDKLTKIEKMLDKEMCGSKILKEQLLNTKLNRDEILKEKEELSNELDKLKKDLETYSSNISNVANQIKESRIGRFCNDSGFSTDLKDVIKVDKNMNQKLSKNDSHNKLSLQRKNNSIDKFINMYKSTTEETRKHSVIDKQCRSKSTSSKLHETDNVGWRQTNLNSKESSHIMKRRSRRSVPSHESIYNKYRGKGFKSRSPLSRLYD